MGRIKRFVDDIKLYYRYACRRLGVPGYQIHQIYLPEQKLIYIPIPKNACTTVKHAMHEIEFGKRFNADLAEFGDYREHHDYYLKRRDAFTSVEDLKNRDDCFRFGLVRDPVKRLLSCYRNRVLDLGDLESSRKVLESKGLSVTPDLNSFALNLEGYQKANKSIEHHTRPQAKFLGTTIGYLDRIFTLSEMQEMQQMLRSYHPDLNLRQRKTGGTVIRLNELSREALEAVIDFYSKDYKLLADFFTPEEIRREYECGISD